MYSASVMRARSPYQGISRAYSHWRGILPGLSQHRVALRNPGAPWLVAASFQFASICTRTGWAVWPPSSVPRVSRCSCKLPSRLVLTCLKAPWVCYGLSAFWQGKTETSPHTGPQNVFTMDLRFSLLFPSSGRNWELAFLPICITQHLTRDYGN